MFIKVPLVNYRNEGTDEFRFLLHRYKFEWMLKQIEIIYNFNQACSLMIWQEQIVFVFSNGYIYNPRIIERNDVRHKEITRIQNELHVSKFRMKFS